MYGVKDGTGRLIPSNLIVGKDDPERAGISRRLWSTDALEIVARRRAAMVQAVPGQMRVPTTGTMKNLVLLVEFLDVPHSYTREQFEALFNQVGYTVDGAGRN